MRATASNDFLTCIADIPGMTRLWEMEKAFFL